MNEWMDGWMDDTALAGSLNHLSTHCYFVLRFIGLLISYASPSNIPRQLYYSLILSLHATWSFSALGGGVGVDGEKLAYLDFVSKMFCM